MTGQSDRADLAALVTAALDEHDFSGVAVVDGRDGPLVQVARGPADRASGQPITIATRFGLASASKLFTAATVLSLVRDGLLELDRPVADLLGADERPARLAPSLTVRHLLTHTSGLTDYFDEYGETPYEAIWDGVPSYRMRTPRDMLGLFRDLPPRAVPGAEVRYCNAAFVLLAVVVERATGSPFPAMVERAVFGPAGMIASGYPALDEVVPELAVGHVPPASAGGPWRTNVFSIPAVGGGDGGAVSTAGDLVRFLRALGEGRLIGQPLLDEAVAPAVRDDHESLDYGLGFQIGGEPHRRWIGHMGEDPGYSVRVAWYRTEDLRIVVLSNVSEGSGGARRAIGTAVFG